MTALSRLDLSCSQSQPWDNSPTVLQNSGSGLIYSPAFPFNKFTATKLGGLSTPFGSHQLHRGQKGLPGFFLLCLGISTCVPQPDPALKSTGGLTGRCALTHLSTELLLHHPHPHCPKGQEPVKTDMEKSDKMGRSHGCLGKSWICPAFTLCDSSSSWAGSSRLAVGVGCLGVAHCSLLRPQVLPSLPWCCDTDLGPKPNLLQVCKANN